MVASMQTAPKVLGVGRKPDQPKKSKTKNPNQKMKSKPKNEITNELLTKEQIADRVHEMHMHIRSLRESADALEKSLKPSEATFLTREDLRDICGQIEASGELIWKDLRNLY
jgi:hypothetical protein